MTECDGKAAGNVCVGKVRRYDVTGNNLPNLDPNPYIFNYCDGCVAIDKARGFEVRYINESL